MCPQQCIISSRILRACGGSSSLPKGMVAVDEVFSAHAEVVPPRGDFDIDFGGILRACGGSSVAGAAASAAVRYSPRMRR